MENKEVIAFIQEHKELSDAERSSLHLTEEQCLALNNVKK